MESNQVYKNRALASLEGHWGNAVLASFIYFVLVSGVGGIFDWVLFKYSSYIWMILCFPFMWGFCVYFLNLVRQEDVRLERLFDGYKDIVRIFLAYFISGIVICLGLALLIVPGIILSLAYSQVSFILKDNPEMSAVDALKKSREMMKGHKGEYFVLGLSFIGWILLAILTLGVGLIALEPYMYATMAHFYEDLKAEQKIEPIV